MNKYLVKIESVEYRQGLVDKFEKVGTAESMPDLLLVTTEQPISVIRECAGVVMVESDGMAEMLVDQPDAPEWGLPWISNSGGSYENDKSGNGVDIYVVDTGVRDTHVDLVGRVRTLYSFDGAPYSLVGDQSPTHGTSVSGCAAGSVYGTAKEATIVNCRIDWSTSDILKALDKVLRDHLDKPDERQSILNFSGSSLSSIIGDAFERLTQYGVVVVAAAGNSSEDRPRWPARNTWVIAVGAINEQEKPAWFTNKNCDVYSPGQDIVTASVFSDTSINTISGTSFSAPYYAGLLACLIEGSDKFNSSSTVSDFIWRMRNQMMETNRIANFPNGGLPVRTATTNGLGGNYYVNPSKAFTDSEIRDWLVANADNPQVVADACESANLSLNRLNRIAGPDIGIDDLNKYFKDAGVTPWWFT